MTMRRASPTSRSRLVLICGAWLAALACGEPTMSLDRGPGTTGSDDGGSEGPASTGDVPPPGDDPPICAPECTPILTPTWAYEGSPGAYAVVEMLRAPDDGSLWLGIQQAQSGATLVQLSASGELLWSAAPGLTCDRCELSDIALHPSGDVLLGATSREDPGAGEIHIARIDVATRTVAWERALALDPGADTVPRLGELAVLDEDRIAAVRVNGFPDGELLELLDLTGDGELRWQSYIGVQPGSGGAWPPLLVRAPTGELVLAHAWWNDLTERMMAASSRLVPPTYEEDTSHVPLPLRLDDLVVDSRGRRLELARSQGTDTITLVLTSRRSSDPERWTASLPLLTTASTRAALAVGPDDQVYAVARTTPRAPPGEPYVVTLEVARWSSDGALRWQSSRPLELMATPDPVELVIDDGHGVIVGTVIRGRPHVERFEQTCSCE